MPVTVYRLFTPVRYGCVGEFCFINFVDPTVSNVVLFLLTSIRRYFQIASYSSLGYYTVNFFISSYATVRSCVNYRALIKSVHQINITEKHELKLICKFTLIDPFNSLFLVHSCFMFLLLVARYVYQITVLISNFMKSMSAINTAQLILPIIGSFYSLCGSPMLLILTKQVRRDFFRFYREKLRIFWNLSRAIDS